jgi:hypothetical protein
MGRSIGAEHPVPQTPLAADGLPALAKLGTVEVVGKLQLPALGVGLGPGHVQRRLSECTLRQQRQSHETRSTQRP